MIAASEPQEFVPFGRQQLKNLPRIAPCNDQNNHVDSTLSSRLSQVVITDSFKSKESWLLRTTKKEGVECEEELFYKDKTVVWSIGPASVENRTNRVLKCCYTSETPVQEALWANFHLSAPNFPATFFTVSPLKSLQAVRAKKTDYEDLKNCICILNSSAIKCFTPSGSEFATSLQFLVNKIWPFKYGLLLERKVNREAQPINVPTAKKKNTDLRRQSIEQSFLQKGSFSSAPFFNLQSPDPFLLSPPSSSLDLPTLFTLSHPLDEICPITTHSDFMDSSNLDLKIIFTNENPSLCLTYNRKSGLHGIYLMRKALPHEAELCCRREPRPSHQNSFSSSTVGKKTASGNNSFSLDADNRSLPPFLSARTRKSLGLGGTFPNLPPSPYAPFDVRTSSPAPKPFTSSSPYHLTPVSRKGDTSSSYSCTPSRLETRMISEDTVTAEAKPLYPQICLQCIWQESQDSKGQEGNSEATKGFLSTDIMGQKYICYLVNLKLYILQIEVRSDEDFSVIGEPCYLQAKDASPLESRNMIAVIGLDGGVEVYTGPVHVAKILISGVSSSVATPSYLSDFNSGPTFFSRPSPGAYPKRSSLLPQPVPQESPIFNESFSQFSPVTTSSGMSPTLPSSREGTLVALKDNAGGRISLEYSSALLFRLELPHFGNSPLIDSITTTLTSVLPRPVALQFLIKWYCTRNSPGCYNLSLEEEFQMFSNLLYSSLGYDVEILRGDQLDQSSPVTRPKKLRTSELQSDEDWAALIGSQHHKMGGRQMPLNLPSLKLRPCDFPLEHSIMETPMVTARSSQTQDTPVGVTEKSKRATKKESLVDYIDATPMPPKHSSGKGRIPSNRFHKSLEKGTETPSISSETQKFTKSTSALRNKKALLYPHASTIIYSLHLLYEDLKLNNLRANERDQLISILYQLVKDAGCDAYLHHYWIDSPGLCKLVRVLSPRQDISPILLKPPPSIFRHLNDILLKKTNLTPYKYLPNVNKRSKDLIEIFGLMSYDHQSPVVIFHKLLDVPENEEMATFPDNSTDPAHLVALHMTRLGMNTATLQTLPAGIAFPIYEPLYRCRDSPAHDWDQETYKLIERHDLASLSMSPLDKLADTTNKLVERRKNENVQREGTQDDDGMMELGELDTVRLRWAADQRIIELRRMLQSAFPVRISLQQRQDVSDHEFMQELERHLYAICARTMALPVARGMVTLGCAKPVITEKLPIPQLCLTGKIPPSDKMVEMTHIEVPANMNDWPLFHNGVAAGLKISGNAPDIDSQWIIYNKPKTNLEEAIEHGGFLMALGLNGHLADLHDLTIFMYLVKNHEMTRVGLLLGIAVSKRGTMDAQAVKMVSIHVEAMLPPTGIELDVDVIVEPASLMALGFLYQGTGHRHIAQVLLQELGKPPGPEMESSVDRESYSLSAGLALGLVVFGQGNSLSGLADMAVPDTLHHMIVGGPKRPYLGSQRDKYKTASYLTSEGPLVNPHVTGPGATLALGMLYFNTGNKAVAEWLKIPETQHLLEIVLPDHLLLRTLAKSLILWDEIEPTEDWVVNHVPAFVRPHCLVKPLTGDEARSIDYETMNQAYCNIVAGACMAIGLRFAGSAHQEAYETLSYFVHKFTLLLGKSIADLCGRATLETCLNVTTVSLGMVMAGTGNLEVMRLCRYVRSRVGPSNSVVTYGSHMATHMALGLLFLGGGTLTLSTSQDAIAALLCAFYPKWPICSSDNRYHLQALRHLYVLAVQPRLLLPRDIDTKMLCYAHVTYVYRDDSPHKKKTVRLLAPCLLPELKLLKEVRIEDDRYWGIRFTEGKSWKELTKILSNSTFVDVKQRAGSQSYIDDPQGFRSLLAQTLTSDDIIPWGVKPPSIFQFSSNPTLENFLHIFFDEKNGNRMGESERKTLSAVTYFAYFCLTRDKMCLLPHWLSLFKLSQLLVNQPSSYAIWQWKLVISQAQKSLYQLIPADIALSVKQDISSLLTSWEPGVLVQAKDYLLGNFDKQGLDEGRVTAYLTYHDIPYRGDVDLNGIHSGDLAITLAALSSSGMNSSAIASMLTLMEI